MLWKHHFQFCFMVHNYFHNIKIAAFEFHVFIGIPKCQIIFCTKRMIFKIYLRASCPFCPFDSIYEWFQNRYLPEFQYIIQFRISVGKWPGKSVHPGSLFLHSLRQTKSHGTKFKNITENLHPCVEDHENALDNSCYFLEMEIFVEPDSSPQKLSSFAVIVPVIFRHCKILY